MITAYKIGLCAHLNTLSLEEAMVRGGNKFVQFIQSKFIGITNAQQFCYEVLYWEPEIEDNAYSKVFVDLNHNDEPVGEW